MTKLSINKLEAGAILLNGEMQKLTAQEIINIAAASDFCGNAHKPTIVRLVKKSAELAENRWKNAERQAEKNEQIKRDNLTALSNLPADSWANLVDVIKHAHNKKTNQKARELAASYGINVNSIFELKELI